MTTNTSNRCCAIVVAMTYEGGCHCGAVRFRISVASEPIDVVDCNCTICTKKGILHVIVPEPDFAIIRGAEALSVYTFGTHTAKHMFCRTCGIHPFYRPRSHPDAWDVNFRCLDEEPAPQIRLRNFDGANWEANVDRIR